MECLSFLSCHKLLGSWHWICINTARTVTELAFISSGELIYLYENFLSHLLNFWQPEIVDGKNIYTMEIGKHPKSETFFFFFPELQFTSNL